MLPSPSTNQAAGSQTVDSHEVELRIESFLDNFKRSYAEWQDVDVDVDVDAALDPDPRSVDPLTSSDSGTSLCTVQSLSSISEGVEGTSVASGNTSSSSHVPNSDSASTSLSMKSSGATSRGTGSSATGSEAGSRSGTPKNLGKFRHFYKSAYLALSQTSDFERGKYQFQ